VRPAARVSPTRWPFFSMGMSSMPARVAWAASNDLPPRLGRVTRLTLRWSGSTLFWRYVSWRIAFTVPCSWWSCAMAAALAALPSIVLCAGTPWQANRLRPQSSGRVLIPRRGAENGTRLAGCRHGASHRPPLPWHAEVGLVQAPAAPYRALAAREPLFERCTLCQNPAVDGGGVNGPPARRPELFPLAIAPRIRHIPTPTGQAHSLADMGPLDADHDGSRARVVPRRTSGTDHTRNRAPRKICDRTKKVIGAITKKWPSCITV
jgi:hypothetical protein